MKVWDRYVRLNEALFDWCLSFVDKYSAAGELERALEWGGLAAWWSSNRGFSGKLSSTELESLLLQAAGKIDVKSRLKKEIGFKRWLHVLNSAYPLYGHTKLCRMWIKMDSSKDHHSVVLLGQKNEVPGNLLETVGAKNGGEIWCFEPGLSLIKKSEGLRKLAQENADIVVLHTHPDDVISTVAFGVPGGPPVLFLNHADHVFWCGGSVADLVVDIRESGNVWTKMCRGIQRVQVLPIPLMENENPEHFGRKRESVKMLARKNLGLPDEDVLLLTIGNPYKYSPVQSLNFIEIATCIVKSVPGVRLVAVGPQDTKGWRRARKQTDGRVMAVGKTTDLGPYLAASDVYLEGFPMGSLTAMLEAGLSGLPCVRAPKMVPPPYCSDGIAFSELPQPNNLETYMTEVVKLVRDPLERERQGKALSENIRNNHCGEGWGYWLNRLRESIPSEHKVYQSFRSGTIEEKAMLLWLEFLNPHFKRNIALGQAMELLKESASRGMITSFGSHTSQDRDLVEIIKSEEKMTYNEEYNKKRVLAYDEKSVVKHLNRFVRKQFRRHLILRESFFAYKSGNFGLARRFILKGFWFTPTLVLESKFRRIMLRVILGDKLFQYLRKRKSDWRTWLELRCGRIRIVN